MIPGPTKILLIHAYYQIRGGEDQVFETESALLKSAGYDVTHFTFQNSAANEMNSLQLARSTLWNRRAYSQVRRIVHEQSPDIVHIHNTFPLLSPAVHHAARSSGAAVVQTLHNYRLSCPAATFFRDGRTCELCKTKLFAWPAITHSCYRSSRAASAGTATMLLLHRLLRTWSRKVDAFVALTEFSKRKYVEGGLPTEKIFTKPNVVFPDPGVSESKSDYGLFVGRLSPEKGLMTLLSALEKLSGTVPLTIVGKGPMETEVHRRASTIPRVNFLGERPPSEVLDLIGAARFLVIPSEWYEGFPRVAVESLARGTPVIAARIGSLEEMVTAGSNGIHFTPGDPVDLSQQMVRLTEQPTLAQMMGRRARSDYVAKYSAPANLERLQNIYGRAIDRRARRPLLQSSPVGEDARRLANHQIQSDSEQTTKQSHTL